MSDNKLVRKIIFIASFMIISVPLFVSSQDISLTIGDATGRLGEKFIPLDIRISTNSVEIGGFNIWLQLDRPDLVKFQPLYDSSSFIMPTWFTDTRSLSGMGTDINIVSLNLNGTAPNYIIPPQNDELLIRLFLEVVDSLILFPSMTDSVVNILLQTQFRDHFSFSTPTPDPGGYIYEYYLDSTCYVCDAWVDTICTTWRKWIGDPGPVEIDTSNCDSISIVLDSFLIMDTTFWQISNGTFTLLPSCGYASGTYDISNLVALVDYMFADGPEKTLAEADYNCDCEIDISDLVGFVSYMFQAGAEPGCVSP